MLYFFEGHHTKEQDFLSVKAFAEHTNVIPIIAKGDQFTVDELRQVKKDIMDKAREMKVGFFDARSALNDIADENLRNKIIADCMTDHELAPCPPFVIINPTQKKLTKIKKEANKYKQKFGRSYPWGFVDSMDDKNSDFSRLSKMVLRHLRGELAGTMEEKYRGFVDNIKQEELEKMRLE